MKHLLKLLLVAISLIYSTSVHAQDCDLSAYNNSLFQTESAGSGGYEAANSIGATGMYQFMPSTAQGLQAYQNAPPQCRQMGVRGVGLATQECAGVQEAMQQEFTLNNLRYLQNNCPAAVAAVGTQTVQGYVVRNGVRQPTEPCTVSWSGLLAGAHLGGAGGICNTITTGRDVDDAGGGSFGTSRLHYVCRHRDLPVPSVDCNPTQFPTPEGDYTPQPYTGWSSTPVPAGRQPGYDLGIRTLWVPSFMHMTSQITQLMMQQAKIIATFLDSKHQLETQRLLQQKTAEVHKKYSVSEQMCKIGTFTKGLADAEQRARLSQKAFARSALDRQLRTGDSSTVIPGSDEKTKLESYLQDFCNANDNAGQFDEVCTAGGDNEDIDYTRSISSKLTLDIDLFDGAENPDEPTIFAFLDHIFMHQSLPFIPQAETELASFVEPYMEMRSLMAMRSVAQNSFSYILSERAQGSSDAAYSAAPFLKAMLIEMGIPEVEAVAMIGENPSYYAQMEFLTRKIFYHPQFITNLYDKPANVKRIAAALTAIKSMQNWQIAEALKRREMLFSILLEIKLREKQTELETFDIPRLLATDPDDLGLIPASGTPGGGPPPGGTPPPTNPPPVGPTGNPVTFGSQQPVSVSSDQPLTVDERRALFAYGEELSRIMTDTSRPLTDVGDAAINAGCDVIYGEDHSVAATTFSNMQENIVNSADGEIEGVLLELPPEMQNIFTPEYLENNSIEQFAIDWQNGLVDRDINSAQSLLDQGFITQDFYDDYVAEAQLNRGLGLADFDQATQDEIFSLYQMAQSAADRGIPVIANDVDGERGVLIDIINRQIPDFIRDNPEVGTMVQSMSPQDQVNAAESIINGLTGIPTLEEFNRIMNESMSDRTDLQAAIDAGIDVDGDGSLLIHRGYAHIDGSYNTIPDGGGAHEYDDLLEDRGNCVATLTVEPTGSPAGNQNDPPDFRVMVSPDGSTSLQTGSRTPQENILPLLNTNQ
ncbi:MAG: hypothetical protein AAF549_02730 [Pseudomonadota bacterium]